MLRRLEIENFFSVAERQVLDLTIAANATDPDGRFAAPIPGDGIRLPRVVALFGANASGKTTVLRAIAFLVDFARNSIERPADSRIRVMPFLGTNHPAAAEIAFSVEFDAVAFPEQSHRALFRYDLAIASDGSRVLRESLKWFPKGKSRRLFDRKDQTFKFSSDFPLSRRDPIIRTIRENASVISALAKFNHPIARSFSASIGAFATNVVPFSTFSPSERAITEHYAGNRVGFDRFIQNVRRLDLGIQSASLTSQPEGFEVAFQHRGLGQTLPLELESQGTRNFFRLFPYLDFVLTTGGAAVVDEFDADIHPLVLPEIVRLFQDPETNPDDAQLIFSCHNASLLDALVKEEVVLTEKGSEGASRIYRLADVQGVRRDSNYYAKYMMGVYGAIPQVG